MNTIVFLGSVAKDKVVKLDKPIKTNTKERAYGSQSNIGGPAATASVVAALHGDRSIFIGTVGDDAVGDECKRILSENYNVNTDLVVTLENYETPNSFIIVAPNDKGVSTRTIVSGRDARDKTTPPSVGEISYGNYVDGFLTDGQYPEAAIQFLKEHPEAISVIDAGRATEPIMNLCKSIKYVICSEEFAQAALKSGKIDTKNQKQVKNAYNKLFKKLELDPEKNKLVITLGAQGCYYGDGNFLSALENISPVVDTTGAGDIFHGAFIHAILEFCDDVEALRYATTVSGISTEKMGGIPSIPTKEQVYERIDTLPNPNNEHQLTDGGLTLKKIPIK